MARRVTRAPSAAVVRVVLGTLLLCAPLRALQAGEADDPAHLDYHASASCPDEATFRARVRAKMRRRANGLSENDRRTFVVNLEAGPPAVGELTVMDGDTREGTRSIAAPTCDVAADGVALIVALALDRRHREPAAEAQPDEAPAETPPAIAEPQPPPSPPAPGPETMSSHAPRAPSVAPFFAGATAVLATGAAPRPLLTASPYVGWSSERGTVLHLAVRASFLRVGTGEVAVPGGSADFTWTVGRVDGCALLRPVPVLAWGGCARVEGGVLDVAGSGIAAPQTHHRGWFAVGAAAHLEWVFLGPLALSADVGPLVRFTADRFYVLPSGTTAYQVPVLALEAESGLAVHFP